MRTRFLHYDIRLTHLSIFIAPLLNFFVQSIFLHAHDPLENSLIRHA